MKHFIIACLAGASLMACTPASEPVPETPVTPAASTPEAPPAGVGPDVRYLRPNTQMTMDFRPDRLNIAIDANDVITGFRCT